MRWILSFFFVIGVLAAGVVGYGAWSFYSHPASEARGEVIVDVPPNSTLLGVVAGLEAQGLRLDPLAVRLWARITGSASKLRVGEYSVQSQWSPAEILDAILHGAPRSYKIVVKEGWHIWDIEKAFADSQFKLEPAEFQRLVSDRALLDELEVPQPPTGVRRTLEGYLFPETYTYFKYDTPATVVRQMVAFYKEKALPILKQHPWGQTPEGRYKLLTLASIVEKESGDVAEQPTIASVYWNRLNKSMLMQADPTTIYGLMPHFNGNLRKVDLLTPTPYNTYRIKGLPAGPIANPGLTALQSTVKPASTNYLFFVARGNGTHLFSADYKTHSRAVDEFQKKIRPASAKPTERKQNNRARR
jgi:UPF0755 protein